MLHGEAGSDVLNGDGGNDILAGGADDDRLIGGADNDRLLGGDGNDTLYGGIGNDMLEGEGGENQLFGEDGSDKLVSAGIGDQLDGGAGSDYLLLTSASRASLVTGGAGNDVIDLMQTQEDSSWNLKIMFGAGSGHDVLLVPAVTNYMNYMGGMPFTIDMATILKSEVTIIWQAVFQHQGRIPSDEIDGDWFRGDLVIRINATGDTLLLRDIWGVRNTAGRLEGLVLPQIEFADGSFRSGSFPNDLSEGLINVQVGDVSIFDTAEADYSAANAQSAASTNSASGDDRLEGAVGHDALYDAGNDIIVGDMFADGLHGSEGGDRFAFASATGSRGLGFDIIFDLNSAVGRIDPPDQYLVGRLGVAGEASTFSAASGDFAGRAFVIADADGVAGHKVGADYMIALPAPPMSIDTALFI